MNLTYIDLIAFGAFLAVVVGVSLYAGRRERTSEDYFLAGRTLTWWLIGVSLIASNISTEHFIGMAGTAFGRVRLAIASYEWMAAVTLVLVAWFLLPRFLRAGIYTMPEYLEYRYDVRARTLMAFYLMVAYIVVAEHPYYEVTDEKGAFELNDVPPGTYTLSLWHETLGQVTQQVTVKPGEEARVEFTLSAK
ncbi:MAG: carboxypeptidase regulatory-like domain-containing protein [Planctomycetes bacterium]|nr:carboxypeptidase regulatory-like domain-containing protein [Planctomycetota bacterium]